MLEEEPETCVGDDVKAAARRMGGDVCRDLASVHPPRTSVVVAPFPADDRSLGYERGTAVSGGSGAAHNRLWMSVAQGLGHELEGFGKERFCEGGALA